MPPTGAESESRISGAVHSWLEINIYVFSRHFNLNHMGGGGDDILSYLVQGFFLNLFTSYNTPYNTKAGPENYSSKNRMQLPSQKLMKR